MLSKKNYQICATSPGIETEDDGSVFTEENGVRTNIRPGEMVRACGAFETTAAITSKYRNYNTVMPVWLESKEQINTKVVEEALWFVSRQVPYLQFCISKRRGRLWFKRMMNLEIDFETSMKNEMEVLHEMLDTSFDIWKGPLWKVKLVVPQDDNGNSDSFSAVIVFTILHAINDGVTNMKIIRDFVTSMNQLTAGKVVTTTFAPVIPPVDSIARLAAPVAFLVKRAVKKLYSTLVKNFHHETSFSGRIPFPETRVAKTKVLIGDFSEGETELIAKMCKGAKVSINTFVITVANFALMTIAQSKSDIPLGTRKILIAQNVNVRRHFDAQYSDAPGYHVSLLEDEFKMSLADADNFWTLASENHLQLKDSLEIQKDYLKIIPIYYIARIYYTINNFLTIKGYKNKTMVHYVTSNMGNLKGFLPEPTEEDDIKVTYLLRSCSLQLTGSLFMLNFQTLNKKMVFSMDYYTNQMKTEIAQEFLDVFFKLIRNLISSHRLNGELK